LRRLILDSGIFCIDLYQGKVRRTTCPGMRVCSGLLVATRLSATPAQVVLAWLIPRPSVTASIVSATSVGQFHYLMAAVQLKFDAVARLGETSNSTKT